jgi:hypothetical protein
MTAGQLWLEAGLSWQAKHMSPQAWQGGITRALNDYDRRVLVELQAQPQLPEDLAHLRDHMVASGQKAEQEGWV